MTTDTRRLELVALREIAGAQKNPKKHAQEDIGKSIGRFGYVEPCVMDERTQRLVAGHGRVQALRVAQMKGEAPPQGVEARDGEWFVPVLRGWASRSDAEAQAYLVASNHLTTKGGWEDEGLAEILKQLEKEAALDGTGFTGADVANFLDDLSKETPRGEGEGHVSTVIGNVYQVLVEVTDEAAQAQLIDRLEKEGFKCRPLVF